MMQLAGRRGDGICDGRGLKPALSLLRAFFAILRPAVRLRMTSDGLEEACYWRCCRLLKIAPRRPSPELPLYSTVWARREELSAGKHPRQPRDVSQRKPRALSAGSGATMLLMYHSCEGREEVTRYQRRLTRYQRQHREQRFHSSHLL